MAQKPIDHQKVNKIYELFEAGLMISEIVIKLGTNRETIRQYLLKKYSPEQKRAIVKRNFRQLKGQDSPNWKGGRELTKDGYICLRLPDGKKILEHRLIMQNHLGRKLDRHEVVHHINGNNADNRLANLQLTSMSEDIRRHQLVRNKS